VVARKLQEKREKQTSSDIVHQGGKEKGELILKKKRTNRKKHERVTWKTQKFEKKGNSVYTSGPRGKESQ